ncbi:MAG: hypothetical protein HQK83_13390 [Fibrobacteria bacterium]|nr:hypothetical protein [Fibrobacteria bacterium]
MTQEDRGAVKTFALFKACYPGVGILVGSGSGSIECVHVLEMTGYAQKALVARPPKTWSFEMF